MRRSIDGEPLSDDGEAMTLADCDPGDVVAIGPRRYVLIGNLLGMHVGKRRRKAEPHTALLQDVDPDTLLLVVHDDPERELRVWYAALPDTPVLEMLETVDHRRDMRRLVDRRQLRIVSTDYFSGSIDPMLRRPPAPSFPIDEDVPF